METTTESSFWFVSLACLGGVIVLVGLLMEALAEKRKFKNIDSFRRCHAVKNIGKWVLIGGIAVEIVIGAVFAKQEWLNDPWSGNISEMSADVYFELGGTNAPEGRQWQGMGNVALMFLGNAPSPALTTLFHLTADSFDFKQMTYGWNGDKQWDVRPSYSLHFTPQGSAAEYVGINAIRPVKEIKNIRCIWIWMKFLPPKKEVKRGDVTLVTNGRILQHFIIPPQISQDFAKSGSAIVATNSQRDL